VARKVLQAADGTYSSLLKPLQCRVDRDLRGLEATPVFMELIIRLLRGLFGISLTIQMIIATLLGLLCGLFFGELCSVFAPWGTAYIMILKVTTIPYLICAIMHGIGKLSTQTGKQILQKGLLFIASAWVINIFMIYIGSFLFPKTHGVPYASFSGYTPSSINFAELLIPDNIFHALSNNTIPSIVVFGLLIGIALMHIKEKNSMMSLLETLVDALTRITQWIARITPIGTFLIIANQAGSIQFSTLKQVGTYLILYITIILTIVFWVFPRIVSSLTSISASRWVRDLFPILVLAYTTNAVIVTLPFIIELIKRETQTFYHKDGKIQDEIQGIVSVIFNLPLGSLFIALFVFFVAAFYHVSLSIGSQVQLFVTTFLTSLGAVGLGSWINSLNFLLDSLGLPLEAIDLYLSVMPFTAGFQSMISVVEISSLALLVALACHNLITFRWEKVLKGISLALGPVFVLAILFKPWNPLPPISNPYITIHDIDMRPPVSVHVYKPGDALPPLRGGDSFDKILRSKTLRIGYTTFSVPFCFENTLGHLAGYDVAFAYQLAYDLGCSLEFVPISLGNIAEELSAGLYDIAMSGISITEDRLKIMGFTNPYLESRIVFVMSKKNSKILTSVEAILERPEIKVAVLKGSSYDELAKSLFPAEQIIWLDHYDEFSERHPHAVLIRGEPQAIAWSVRNPSFAIVVPSPPIGQDSLAYGVRVNSVRLLNFLNQWLRLKENEEFTHQQYELWVLGKTETTIPKEPRWSIVRNVLQWDD